MRLPLLFAFAAVGIVALAIGRGPGEHAPEAAAQGSQMRIVVPFLSREVLPDVVIESISVTGSQVFEASYTYRIRNIGDAPADLSTFTMQAWFSSDALLDKGSDPEAGVFGFSVTLAPGAVLEAEARAENLDADIAIYPYLVLEIASDGSVEESNTANNVTATLRPPLDLLTDVTLAWDEPNERSIVTWVFRGEVYGLEDAGFRISAIGFATLEVPAGTREVLIPFDPLTGARPCMVSVQPLILHGGVWPAADSNNLCQ